MSVNLACLDTGEAAITVPLTTTIVGDTFCGVDKRAALPCLLILPSYSALIEDDGNGIYLTTVPLTTTPLNELNVL